MRAMLIAVLAALFAIAAPAAAQAERGVADPRAFVAEVYAAYARGTDQLPPDPSPAYSDRLQRLFADYDVAANGELLSLDFDWWVLGQDWEITGVTLAEQPDGADRRTITARFRNFGEPRIVRFQFVREQGRWFLDDAIGGEGEDRFVLSELLLERP